jgi:hypothetical protein
LKIKKIKNKNKKAEKYERKLICTSEKARK